jgi:AraC-type DNA-binding domain-containing proteins
MRPNYKPIPADESNLFNVVLQKSKKEFDYPWHYHQECELIYIPSGQGIRYVGNSVENFSDDDLVLVGSNLPHCWINELDQQKNSPNAIVIYLKEDFFDGTWLRSHEFKSINSLLELSGKGIKFGRAVAAQLKDKCLQLPGMPPMQKLITLLQILQELSETKDYRLLCEQHFSCDLDQGNSERMNVIYSYIDKHYRERISLADVAAQLYMTPGYFSKFFSKMMKKSFFEFLNEYKISKSCKLLLETDKSISEICYDSGFESIPFFYRQFKKFKKCQPKQYRQNYYKAFSQEPSA